MKKTRMQTIARSFLVLFAANLLTSRLFPADAPQAPATLAKPVLQRDAEGAITVTCATPDVLLVYTLDNADPTAKSSPYLAPIALPHGGVVKARAFSQDRKLKSELAEAKYEPIRPGMAIPPSTLVACTQYREWPGYDWVKRHNAIRALVKERKPQLVMIGDSITHFFGGEPRDGNRGGESVWKKYYEPRNAVNLGYGWDRTENVIWRLSAGGELEGAEPKVAVVMIGTNNMGLNTATEIALGIEKVCELIHAHSKETKILLLGIFPRDQKPGHTRDKIAEVNKLISKLDGKDNITFLDISPTFLNADGSISKDVMNDYLHPTPKGYQLWADAMEPALSKLFGDAKP
jgi:beta-glucosidase